MHEKKRRQLGKRIATAAKIGSKTGSRLLSIGSKAGNIAAGVATSMGNAPLAAGLQSAATASGIGADALHNVHKAVKSELEKNKQ